MRIERFGIIAVEIFEVKCIAFENRLRLVSVLAIHGLLNEL